MKKIILISLCFLMSKLLMSQDSTIISFGFSINHFTSNLSEINRMRRIHHAVYFSDIYHRQGDYGLGWNYRGTKLKYLNRSGVNFMFPFLSSRPGMNNWYEINLCLGYEWSPKRLKGFYFGGEAFIGKRKYIFLSWTNKYFEAGVQPFVGYKVNIGKHLQLRTEFCIPAFYSDRTESNSTITRKYQRFYFGGASKQLSLELYWKIPY